MITSESRNIAVFYSCENKKGKHDATGAFIPEAKEFQAVHGVPDENMIPVSCITWSRERRRTVVYEALFAIGRQRPLDGIAFFCHGWPTGIQMGISKKEIRRFAQMIDHVTRDYLEVFFYACSVAENAVKDQEIKNLGPGTKGGFADCLARQLGLFNVEGHVDAHKTRGHATWNPYVIRFINSATESRPFWLVEPRSESWYDWCVALRGTDLRFEFPFMSELEIKNSLEVE